LKEGVSTEEKLSEDEKKKEEEVVIKMDEKSREEERDEEIERSEEIESGDSEEEHEFIVKNVKSKKKKKIYCNGRIRVKQLKKKIVGKEIWQERDIVVCNEDGEVNDEEPVYSVCLRDSRRRRKISYFVKGESRICVLCPDGKKKWMNVSSNTTICEIKEIVCKEISVMSELSSLWLGDKEISDITEMNEFIDCDGKEFILKMNLLNIIFCVNIVLPSVLSDVMGYLERIEIVKLDKMVRNDFFKKVVEILEMNKENT
jgi:hypothetical protein